MLIVEGNCNLYDFLSTLNDHHDLIKKYEHLLENKSKIFSKIEEEFIKQLLATPIVLYLKKDSIRNNSFESNLKEYIAKIEYIENPELIIFLDKIDKSDRKNLNVKWIALEINEDVDYNLNKLFKEFVYLDYTLDKKSSNGRIDINNFENRAKIYLKNRERNYLKQFRGYFMKNLFKMQLSSDKRNYYKKELRKIDEFEKELEKHNNKYFKIECLLCKQSFVVSTVHAAKNVLKPKDIFELNKDKTRIALKCDHQNKNLDTEDYTPYRGHVLFSFKPDFEINKDKIDEKIFSYALLKYFYNFDISRDGENIKYLGENNQITSISVKEYIAKRECVEK